MGNGRRGEKFPDTVVEVREFSSESDRVTHGGTRSLGHPGWHTGTLDGDTLCEQGASLRSVEVARTVLARCEAMLVLVEWEGSCGLFQPEGLAAGDCFA